MTKQKSFKERIRTRMGKTGESYATARRQLIEKAETEARKKRTRKTITPLRDRLSDESIIENTGRPLTEWFKLLDKWGAKTKKHGEIVRWLIEEQEVPGWWAQSLAGAYEQDRGLRAPGQRADGTYHVSASKVINVPLDVLFDAFKEPKVRKKWLDGHDFEVRTSRPGKSITAAWEDSTSRLTIAFVNKGRSKNQVAMAHERIPDAPKADELKAFWRERLQTLKSLLED